MELPDKHFRCMEVNSRYVQLIENITTMLWFFNGRFFQLTYEANVYAKSFSHLEAFHTMQSSCVYSIVFFSRKKTYGIQKLNI